MAGPISTRLHRILLLMEGQREYDRGVMRGVRRYAGENRRWILRLVSPGLFKAAAIRDWKPDGSIAAVFSRGARPALLRLKKPLVTVANAISGLDVPRVGSDNVAVGRLAAEHLRERSVRHFAFAGPPDQAYATDRRLAFDAAVRAAGAVCHWPGRREAELIFGSQEQPANLQRLSRWLRHLPRPVGVFTSSDRRALEVVDACRLAGLHVPQEVAVLGVDNDELLCQFAFPPLSSICLPAERVGYEAAQLLDAMIAGKATTTRPLLLPPTGIAARASTDVLLTEEQDLAEAVQFLRIHAHHGIGIADVVKHAAISRRRLERSFRDLFGHTPLQELHLARIARAKLLLSGTDLPITQIASQCGYSNSSRLAVIFKQVTGMTAREFRQRAG